MIVFQVINMLGYNIRKSAGVVEPMANLVPSLIPPAVLFVQGTSLRLVEAIMHREYSVQGYLVKCISKYFKPYYKMQIQH